MGQIDPGEGDLADKDYVSTITFAIMTTSDSACLAALEAVVDEFDRGSVSGLYSTRLTSSSFDIQYTEQAAMWIAEASFSIRWTIGV
jgi:fructose-1,6-bisphosphatase